MKVSKEYNVAGSILGLGQDILLEVLTEMMYIPDAQ